MKVGQVEASRQWGRQKPACGRPWERRQTPCGCRHDLPWRHQLTVQNVSEALRAEQLLQTSHFILQVTHQLIVGILVDDSVAFDVLSPVGVTKNRKGHKFYSRSRLKPEQCAGFLRGKLLSRSFTGVCWEFHRSWYLQDWGQRPWPFSSFHLTSDKKSVK